MLIFQHKIAMVFARYTLSVEHPLRNQLEILELHAALANEILYIRRSDEESLRNDRRCGCFQEWHLKSEFIYQ